MTALIYLRKSRADEGDPDALQRHRETLLNFAQTAGITVVGVYEEIVSGESLYMRPEMLRLLEDISASKAESVLCMDIDRLGRGDMTSQGVILDTFRAANCQIITPRRIYDLNNEIDETYSEFEAFMARQEYKMITRRMRRGVIATAKEGGHTSEIPFGYVRAWDGKRPTLAIEPEQAKWVKIAFDLYVHQNEGSQHIADLFNRNNVPAKKSDAWGRTAIRRILKNEIYTGTWVYNKNRFIKPKKPGDKFARVPKPEEEWIVVPNAFPAIVDKETYQQAQEITQGRQHSPYFTGEFKNPLAGLLYCSKCGKRLQRQHQAGAGKGPYLLCKTPGCSKAIRLDIVEQAVLATLAESMADYLGKKNPIKKGPQHTELIQSLKKELRTLETQRNNLYDLLEQGVYTIEIFTQRSQDLATREKALTAQLQKLEQENSKVINIQELRQRTQYVLGHYHNTQDVTQQNALLKTVISRIDYTRPKDAPAGEFSIHLTLREFSL